MLEMASKLIIVSFIQARIVNSYYSAKFYSLTFQPSIEISMNNGARDANDIYEDPQKPQATMFNDGCSLDLFLKCFSVAHKSKSGF